MEKNTIILKFQYISDIIVKKWDFLYLRFTTCRARVEARAIRIDTGEILATDGKHASGLDLAEAIAGKKALKNAASELATYLIDQISSKWSSDVTSLTSINMVITGLNYKQFVKFKQVLLSSVRDQ